jgi:hypothetical protein
MQCIAIRCKKQYLVMTLKLTYRYTGVCIIYMYYMWQWPFLFTCTTFTCSTRASVAEWLRHRSHTENAVSVCCFVMHLHKYFPHTHSVLGKFESPARGGSNPARTDVTVWKRLSVSLRKVGGLSSDRLYIVSGFSLPPMKTDRNHITEKIVKYGENYTQTKHV